MQLIGILVIIRHKTTSQFSFLPERLNFIQYSVLKLKSSSVMIYAVRGYENLTHLL
jgi:hypothetical protein